MIFALAWGWITKAFSKITLKGVLIAVGVALVAFGVWKAYGWAWERGAQAKEKELSAQIRTLTADRDYYKSFKTEYDTWVKTTKNAQEQFMREQAATIESLNKSLAAAEQAAKNKEVIYRDVTKYIPAEVGDTTYMPIGFVRLWNDSLEGAAPGEAAAFAGVPGSTFQADGQASAVTLSQFAAVAAFNNSEAVQRGVIIEQWQRWYTDTKHNFTEAQRKQAESIPTLSDGPPPGG